MDNTTQIVFMIFTALIFVSVLIQLIMMASMFFIALKTQKKVSSLVDDLRAHTLPMVKSSREMFEELSPKVKVLASNIVETSGRVRATTEEVSQTVQVISSRARVYAAQADGMVTGTLDQISKAGSTIQHRISGPMRQISGIFNGLRAGLNVICQKEPELPREREGDLFV